jgi:signal transduction histidine kinase
MGAIRVQTTAAAVLVVGVSLLVAAVAMVNLLDRALRAHVRTTALIRAQAISDELATGTNPLAVTVGNEEEEFVQLLDADGDVVMSSPNMAGRSAIAPVGPGTVLEIGSVPFEEGPFLAVGISSTSTLGPLTIIVGRSLEGVIEGRAAAASLLAVAVPLLLVVVGVVTWRVVGRALAPVEAIRAEVEVISTHELHRRVPDPSGNDEIARLATTMNRMLTRLEEGQQRQRRFVSDASHELRSPVASIRQHAEVALSHPDQTSVPELAEVVLEEDARLQRIVEDLLLLTRIDEGTLRLRTEPVDLDDLLFDEAARLRSSTDLRIDSAGVSAARVIGDSDKLDRLIRNLTDNAARHASSIVRLAVREADGRVVVEVDDDGPGVPPEMREIVFERFTRLDDARDREHGGAGLGLAIVAEIAAAHGGSASVSDSSLGGARFAVILPRAAQDDQPTGTFSEGSGRHS